MARINNDLRQVFLNLYKQGMKSEKIGEVINKTGRTVRNWIKLLENQGEERLFKIFKPPVMQSPLDLKALKQEFETNKTAFNREIAVKFNCSTRTIEKYRHRWNYTKKKARTKYKEADENLKKST